MKRTSHEAHDAQLLKIGLFALTLLLPVYTSSPTAAGGSTQAARRVEVEEGKPARSTVAAPQKPGSVRGRVVDPRDNPVVGARVRVAGRAAVLTDGRGEFYLPGLRAVERLAVNFSAPGFMDTTRIYNSKRPSVGTNTVVVWPRAARVPLDAGRGGKLTFPGGTVSFPPRALVDERGRALRGKVMVSFSALDVSDRRQIRSAPGDFTARMRDNKVRQLETFGVFEVTVEDAGGRRANMAPGRRAAVELFVPRPRRRDVPRAVGLFSFEQDTGLWVEEGSMDGAPGLASLTASINNLMTLWNADQLLDTTCIKLKVLDCTDCDLTSNLAGSYVEAFGVDYSGLSAGYTDGNGEVCLSVKRHATVAVIAHHPSNPNIHSNPLEISTPIHVAQASDCGNPSLCPLTATTHLASASFFDDLNAQDTLLWCVSDGWANTGDPNFNVGWRADHLDFPPPNPSTVMRLMLDDYPSSNKPFSSGQYRTKCFYGYGTYEATFKTAAPKGSGLVTTFFTYTGQYDGTFDASGPWHDEIDIEILGRPPNSQLDPQEAACLPTDTVMQTNYFVKGSGGHEHKVCLPFDASAAEHSYRFVWSPADIKWYVDYDPNTNPNPVWTATRVGNDPWPSQPGRIYLNLWSGSTAANGWLGPFAYPGTPIYAEYNSIRHIPQP